MFCLRACVRHHHCNRLAARRQDAGGAAERLKQLEKDYDWVLREKANFGRGE